MFRLFFTVPNCSCCDWKEDDHYVLRYWSLFVHVGRLSLVHACWRSATGNNGNCFLIYPQGIAFTGDTVLIRGCGRTDFQEGDSRVLFNSVHERIFSLPDNFRLFPAHDYKWVGSEWEKFQNITRRLHGFQFIPRLGWKFDYSVDLATWTSLLTRTTWLEWVQHLPGNCKRIYSLNSQSKYRLNFPRYSRASHGFSACLIFRPQFDDCRGGGAEELEESMWMYISRASSPIDSICGACLIIRL